MDLQQIDVAERKVLDFTKKKKKKKSEGVHRSHLSRLILCLGVVVPGLSPM